MSECKCDFHTYMVGDGCGVCNPAKALEYALETIADQAAELDSLRAGINLQLREIERLRAQLAAAGLAAIGWRDVADELPKEAQEVLFVRGGKTLHGAWIGGIFWHSNQKMVAAKWMPLPAPQIDAALRGEVKP